MSKKYITHYPGKTIDVQWHGKLCIHIGECGQSEGELFQGGRDPWCQPDLVPDDECMEIIRRCPTGALSYSCKSGNEECVESSNTVQVTYNGPLFVSGDLEVEGATDEMPGVKYRAALCRCGASKNKPFCDNSHNDIHFTDTGSVGESGEALDDAGGKLKINCAENGPLLLKGNVTVIASSGRIAWQGKQAALCRCGASKNKPFCDGSHKASGFKS